MLGAINLAKIMVLGNRGFTGPRDESTAIILLNGHSIELFSKSVVSMTIGKYCSQTTLVFFFLACTRRQHRNSQLITALPAPRLLQKRG